MGEHTNERPPGDYQVGYKRTPIGTRFPNQTRKTPPKKPPRAIATRQMMADLFEALEQPVVQVKNGRRRKVPASVAIDDALVAQAAAGKAWAVRRIYDMKIAFVRQYEEELVQMLRGLIDLEEHERRTGKPLDPENEAIKQELIRRVTNPRELFEQ